MNSWRRQSGRNSGSKLLCLLLVVACSLGSSQNAQQQVYADFENVTDLLAASSAVRQSLQQQASGPVEAPPVQQQHVPSQQRELAAAPEDPIYTPMQNVSISNVNQRTRQAAPGRRNGQEQAANANTTTTQQRRRNRNNRNTNNRNRSQQQQPQATVIQGVPIEMPATLTAQVPQTATSIPIATTAPTVQSATAVPIAQTTPDVPVMPAAAAVPTAPAAVGAARAVPVAQTAAITAPLPSATPSPTVQTAAIVPAAPVVVDFPKPSMSPRAAQLSPSVLLQGYFDWQNIPDSNGKPWTRCMDMVWRSRSLSRGNKLNFVPTHHWIPGPDNFGVQKFCYIYKDINNNMVCGDWTQEKVQEFEDSMTLCFVEVFRVGFTPYLRPHLDDGYGRGIWRNGLLFNPIQQYGGWSYKQIMLDPLAKALSRALRITAAEGTLWPEADKSKPRVYIGLQGEMSATIMRYTSIWMSMIPDLRTTVGTELADVKFGVGLNFNALDQTEYSVSPNTWWNRAAARYPVPSIDGAAIYDMLYNSIDFVGISAYAPYTGPGMFLNEFENSAFNVGESMRTLGNGADLAALVNSGKIELHYSEFGIGGGNEGNSAPAASARMAGKQPWAGVAGFYRASTDPWGRSDLQAYRTEFYTKTLDWLSQPNLKTYLICDVFVWGMASWDMFGIYPDSSNAQGTYRDNNMVKLIAEHNKQVVVAQTYASKDPAAAALVQKQLNAQDVQFASVFADNLRQAAPSSTVQTYQSQQAQPNGIWNFFGRRRLM